MGKLDNQNSAALGGNTKPLPTIALAKREAKEGSAEWFDRVTHERSKTMPLQLEKRRLALSAHAAQIMRSIQNVQIAKKGFMASTKKMRESIAAERAARRAEVLIRSDLGPDFKNYDVETERVLAEFDAASAQNELNYEVTIAQLMGHVGNIEGHCLTVDCLSIRHDAKVKGKPKWGRARYSITSFIHDASLATIETNAMMRELYKVHGDAEALEKALQEEGISDADDELEEDEVVTEEAEKEQPTESEK